MTLARPILVIDAVGNQYYIRWLGRSNLAREIHDVPPEFLSVLLRGEIQIDDVSGEIERDLTGLSHETVG